MDPDPRRRLLIRIAGGAIIAGILLALSWPILECPNLAADLEQFDAYVRASDDSPELQKMYRRFFHIGCRRCGGTERVSALEKWLPFWRGW